MSLRKLLIATALLVSALGTLPAPATAVGQYLPENWAQFGFSTTNDISANDWVAGSGKVGNATLPMVMRVGDPASKKISNWSGTAVQVNDNRQAVIQRANNQLILWDFATGKSAAINTPPMIQDPFVVVRVLDFNNSQSLLIDAWSLVDPLFDKDWIGVRSGAFWTYTELVDFDARDINNNGVVTGTWKGHAATWTAKTGAAALSAEPADVWSVGHAVNDTGIVVGERDTNGGQAGGGDPFVWNPLTKTKVSLASLAKAPTGSRFRPWTEGLSNTHKVIGMVQDYGGACDTEQVVVLDLVASTKTVVASDDDPGCDVASPHGLSNIGHSAHGYGNGLYRRLS